ncbi:hypothetical protein Tco_1125327 [Tanacetum coccineum]|uniref:Reverse transcriptase Ty1/copia-type domain-containing protein n=1 Tax=Tanacetum coccineum TaxID=301880 RepID=A0ABQ5JBI9_9ASTR
MFKLGASHTLEATHVEFFSDEDEPEVDLGNITNSYTVPTTPNTRIHKDHPIKNVIGDIEPTCMAKALYDYLDGSMQHFMGRFKLQEHGMKPDNFSVGLMGLRGKDRTELLSRSKRRIFACIGLCSMNYLWSTDKELLLLHLKKQSMIGSLMYLTTSRPDIMFAVCVCARFQVTPKTSYLLAIKRIFRYLKGKPTLGLWYSRNSPFELVAYNDSDYARSQLMIGSLTTKRLSVLLEITVVIYGSVRSKIVVATLLLLEADIGCC